MESVEKLRVVWTELDMAERLVADAHKQSRDAALVYWFLGLALEHLAEAERTLRDAAKAIKTMKV